MTSLKRWMNRLRAYPMRRGAARISGVAMLLAAAGLLITGIVGVIPRAIALTDALSGRVMVRDVENGAPSYASDRLIVDLSGAAAPPSGFTLQGYLLENADGFFCGDLPVAGGNIDETVDFPGVDLIGAANRFQIMQQKLLLDVTLPAVALGELREVVSSASDTPGQKSYASGLAEQAKVLHDHATFAKEAADSGNLTSAKVHAEHVLNILYGAGNPGYGDHDGNGTPENPGDGYGVLPYAQKTYQLIADVATATDATQHMQDRSAEVQTSIANFWSANPADQTWSVLLAARAQDVLASTTVDEAKTQAEHLAEFGNRIANGADFDDDGTIEPIANEGGALTAFRSAQSAADYFPEGKFTPPPTATPTATNTPPDASTATPTATSTPPGSDVGDDFENDDSCQNARTISTDGAVQTRTFHAEGDVDWLRFSAQANRTYTIMVENTGADADAVIFLHNTCEAPPSDSEGNAFSSVVKLEWDATETRQYFIKLQQFDPSFFGDDVTYKVSVSVDTTPPSAPTDLRCIAESETTVGLQWKRSPERDVTKYRVTYSNQNATSTGNKTVDGADTTITTLTGLISNERYNLDVRALDFSGNQSDSSGTIPCTAAPPNDDTVPSITIQQPTAASVFSTTASLLTVSGMAQDSGGNLSRVHVKNVTTNVEGWDYDLQGSNHGFRVEDLTLNTGKNTLQVTAYDRDGNSSQKNLEVRRLPSSGAAIIIAGQNETLGLQTNIYNSTNRAYRIFQSAGFSSNNIHYLAPVAQDADGDGVSDTDAVASPAAIQQAITTWAKGKVGPDKPLIIYMMDHGLEDKFCASGCNSGFITPDELDTWLRDLEAATNVEITVVYEACVSGSFIHSKNNGVKDTISKEGRVIITSTGYDNNAYASAQGAYFSDAFFSCIADSGNLEDCFNEARQAVVATGVNQTPFLDDNGDRAYNGQDGTVARERFITRFFSSIRPQITAVDVQKAQSNDGVLSATVTEGAETVELVWAAVYGPDFQEPDPQNEITLNLDVPVVRLEPDANQEGRFTVGYPNGFPEALGDYRIIFYAQDRLGINAQPRQPGAGIYLPLINR